MTEQQKLAAITRRHFFKQGGLGIGALALAGLMNDKLFSSVAEAGEKAGPLAVKPPHFAPKAKNIIYLFMAGAPSQIDLLDNKPKLIELNGQKIPEDIIKG